MTQQLFIKIRQGICSMYILGALLSICTYNAAAQAKNDLNVIKSWIRFSDAPNALYHHLAGQAFELLDKRANAVAAIHSLPDWKKRQEFVRKTLLDIVGPFPAKTPLNPGITRTIVKEYYKVEHIVYESQPGFYVTSSFYIPNNLKGKAPAIIYCSGHSDLGYRNPVYQYVILNLVKKGFIVFAFDPVGQGERSEYYDPGEGKSSVGGTTTEHSIAGAQAFIAGSSQARYMIWDGIRAVDYLLTRKEVDPARIGITGRSGGGTQTAYIAAMDDRIEAAAPENYITNFTRLIQEKGPQDAEQNMFNAIERGIDMADYLEVRAPKPALMITTTRDIFNIQGARETAKEASGIFKAYNKPENFRMVTDDTVHASTQKNREAMYAFFQKYLDNPGDSSDKELTILTPDELRVTETGQVSTSLNSETVFSLNRKEAAALENKLQSARKNLPRNFPAAVGSAKKLSGYKAPVKWNEPVFTGRFQKEGYAIEKYFVKGEGDYPVPYLLIKPDHPDHKALIYLNPSGKPTTDLDKDIEWFVRNGITVLAPDIIGTGETGPGSFRGDSYIRGVSYNVWFLSMLIGRSITGIQAGDVIRLANILKKSEGIDAVYGLARKEMAPVLLHAAAFDPIIDRVALIESYASYRSIVMSRFYTPAFIPGTVPAALEAYDLPDLAASLAPRKLMMAGVTDGAANNSDPGNIKEDLQVISDAYHSRKADSQLNIIAGRYTGALDELYKDWIK
ncbi:MAG: acetylxylan esterase [Sphingobacteriales bacterium]|nr:acetylxylan esterase [Sphingobacteriales bacterium]OJY87541.1 MAG: xylan esterase [Sphingobacteriales bacterium 44-15]